MPGATFPLLTAANGNQTSQAYDLGMDGASDTFSVQVSTVGTVTAFSLQLQGSDDGVNFVNAGSAIAAAGITRVTGVGPFRFLQAVVSGWTGTGTINVTVASLPDV